MQILKNKEKFSKFFGRLVLTINDLNNFDKFKISINKDDGIFHINKNNREIKLNLNNILRPFNNKYINHYIDYHPHFPARDAIFYYFHNKEYNSFFSLEYDYNLIKINKETLFFKKKSANISDEEAINELNRVIKRFIVLITDTIKEAKYIHQIRDY